MQTRSFFHKLEMKYDQAWVFLVQTSQAQALPSCLSEPVNDVTNVLNDRGLLNYWLHKKYTMAKFKDESGPEVLTMKHLSIGFEVCLVTIVADVTSFFVEIALTVDVSKLKRC